VLSVGHALSTELAAVGMLGSGSGSGDKRPRNEAEARSSSEDKRRKGATLSEFDEDDEDDGEFLERSEREANETLRSKEMYDMSIRIRDKIEYPNGIKNKYYMEKIDKVLFVRLQRIENPKVRDFEIHFKQFEEEFFDGLPDDMRVMMDRQYPKHTRKQMAMMRYTK
jgi:hypothetical protein